MEEVFRLKQKGKDYTDIWVYYSGWANETRRLKYNLNTNRFDSRRFKKNSVVAIETFISTSSNLAVELNDGWTMVGNNGGYMTQHEHTIVVTDGKLIILTEMNEILN